jgi:hypothetical protein
MSTAVELPRRIKRRNAHLIANDRVERLLSKVPVMLDL